MTADAIHTPESEGGNEDGRRCAVKSGDLEASFSAPCMIGAPGLDHHFHGEYYI